MQRVFVACCLQWTAEHLFSDHCKVRGRAKQNQKQSKTYKVWCIIERAHWYLGRVIWQEMQMELELQLPHET